jgi:hypothetical protein
MRPKDSSLGAFYLVAGLFATTVTVQDLRKFDVRFLSLIDFIVGYLILCCFLYSVRSRCHTRVESNQTVLRSI